MSTVVRINQKSNVSEAINNTKEGIDAANSALGLFSEVLDQIIPWQQFEETIKKLDRYRKDYSNESAVIVGEIKTHLGNAADKYFSATQCIYEWCSLASRLLTIYLQLLDKRDEKTFPALKQLLIKTLDDGVVKMTNGQAKLEESSMSFNILKGKLVTLHSRLTNEFNSQSTYFQSKVNQIRTAAYAGALAGAVGGPFGLVIAYAIAASKVEGHMIPELKLKLGQIKKFFENLQKVVHQANVDIDTTKAKLKDEIRYIGELKIRTDEARSVIPFDDLDALRDNTKDSVKKLIVQCNEYQIRHGKEY